MNGGVYLMLLCLLKVLAGLVLVALIVAVAGLIVEGIGVIFDI